MRACVRVALISVSVPASFGLAGCAAIDELRDTILRWVESERLPSGRGTFADDMPDATPVVPPEKPAKKEASKIAKKQGKSVRDLRRPQSVALPPKKPPIPDSPRGYGRTKLKGNLRRPPRCDCVLSTPRHHRPESFHAKVAHQREPVPSTNIGIAHNCPPRLSNACRRA